MIAGFKSLGKHPENRLESHQGFLSSADEQDTMQKPASMENSA